MKERDDRSVRGALEDAQGEVKDLRAELVETRQTLESDLETERRLASERIADLEKRNSTLEQRLALMTAVDLRTPEQEVIVDHHRQAGDRHRDRTLRIGAAVSAVVGLLLFFQSWTDCWALDTNRAVVFFCMAVLLSIPAVVLFLPSRRP